MNIVVSGIGLVTPLGCSRESTWSNLIAGRSSIRKTNHGLEARVFDFSPNGARSRMGDFALLAATEALRHAGLTDLNIGLVIGQSKPLVDNMSPELLLSSFTGWTSNDIVKRYLKLNGPSTNVVAACATGVAAIQTAAQWIRAGICDVVLAGAAESSLNEFYRAGFENMGVLAHGDEKSARPFDKNRSGFVMGEGAAVLVLERSESAARRKHKPIALLENVVMQHNPLDLIKSDASGAAVARLIKAACRGKTPDYINAHGTGTVMNDRVESKGIRLGLGAGAEKTAVSSTKAATGHLLGAAGAVEAGLAVLALRDHMVPPTLNLETPDPECDLDYVPHTARKKNIERSVSLSYGFGGQMGAVLFSQI